MPEVAAQRRGKRSSAGAARGPLAILKALGPGLIAGASDNDPTTVATLAVIGATTGYGLSWLVVLVIPMLVVVLVISATVGTVTRSGLEDVVRTRYGRGWAYLTLVAVLAVNLITLAADLEGGGAALGLLTGMPSQWFVLPFAVVVAALLIWSTYVAIERILRFVPLIFLSYIVTAFLARPNWGDVLWQTIVPHFTLSSASITGAIALLGTTLTSYAYVWETIETSEERPPIRRLGLVQVDAAVGMIAAGVIFWFIVITTGATLGLHHKPVQTAQDAAAALAPLAGRYASVIFGIGLLTSAVLAVPVLAGTAAYVMAETFGWRGGLDEHFRGAPRFYAALLISLAVAVMITWIGVRPISLLFFSSIAGGLGTPLTLALLLLVARDRRVMGGNRIAGPLAIAGWLVTAVVTAASAGYLWQAFTGRGS